ncbi:unnamed protein product, partial [Laminaria digitata]
GGRGERRDFSCGFWFSSAQGLTISPTFAVYKVFTSISARPLSRSRSRSSFLSCSWPNNPTMHSVTDRFLSTSCCFAVVFAVLASCVTTLCNEALLRRSSVNTNTRFCSISDLGRMLMSPSSPRHATPPHPHSTAAVAV